MAKWKLELIGTGMIGNSPIGVNEEFIVDEKTNNLLNDVNQKYLVIKDLLIVRCPGVIIDPKKIQIRREEIKTEKKTKVKKLPKIKKEKSNNNESKFSIKSILTFILLLPFKLIWRLLKSFFQDMKKN